MNNTNKGFTLIETVLYFALLAVISVLVIGNIITLFKNYKVVRSNQAIEYNAISIFDKLSRDVHDAKNVVVSNSSFSIPQGVLELNIASSTDDTSSTTVRFYLSGGKVKYMKNGVDFGNLSTNAVTVSNFKINYISATSSEAVKVEMTLDNPIATKNFYTTIQLRE